MGDAVKTQVLEAVLREIHALETMRQNAKAITAQEVVRYPWLDKALILRDRIRELEAEVEKQKRNVAASRPPAISTDAWVAMVEKYVDLEAENTALKQTNKDLSQLAASYQARLEKVRGLRIYTDVEVESFRWSDEGDPGWHRSDELDEALNGETK